MKRRGRTGRQRQNQRKRRGIASATRARVCPRSLPTGPPASHDEVLAASEILAAVEPSAPISSELLAAACRREGIPPVDPPGDLDPTRMSLYEQLGREITIVLLSWGFGPVGALAQATALARFERRRVWHNGGSDDDFLAALARHLDDLRAGTTVINFASV